MIKIDDRFFQADYRMRMTDMIRREKFEISLPHEMRNNGADMWIHHIKNGSNDPLSIDLGADMGYFVFTDKGDRIEKALFGCTLADLTEDEVYDIYGDLSDFAAYVKKANPKRIAINRSKLLPHCDTLSANDMDELKNLLGEEICKRFISSEYVISEFRARRVKSEIVLVGSLCEIQREVMEKSLMSIIPGRTTRRDVVLTAMGLCMERGIVPRKLNYNPPYASYSESPESETESMDYIYQPGDFLVWDTGFNSVVNYGTDFKRHAYLLKPGEDKVPAGLQRAWDAAKTVRGILKKTIRSGYTAAQTLEHIKNAIESAGYVYTPYTDTDLDSQIIASLGSSDKFGFSIDSHCIGNSGNSEVAEGPSIAPFRPYRGNIMIYEDNLISFEFQITAYIPEWKKRINLNLEENAVITKNGVETLFPMSRRIITIK